MAQARQTLIAPTRRRGARTAKLADPVGEFASIPGSVKMRFRIDVRTLDGKLSYERDTPNDALHVAEGGKESLGVIITDTQDGKTYTPEAFQRRFGQ